MTFHSLTQTGVFLGTPDYIAPEQAEDASKADIRSDLYSLGGTLYFLLVGKVPYPGATLMQKLKRQLMGPLPSVLEQRPEVPPDLDALVKKLMARDPAARFQTPAEFVDALASVSLKRTPSGKGAATNIDPPKPTAPATTTAAPSAASSVRAHPSGVRALSVSTDGKWLLSGGLDETLRLWDMARFRETRCVAGDVGPVEQAALAPGAKWAASCALRLFKSDMVVQLWDLASGAERRRLKGHTDVIHCVAIAPDGRRVAAGSADQTVRIWALDQPGSPSICLKGHTAAVGSVTFLPGGDSLLSGGHDGLVRLWDVKTGAAKGNLAVKVKNVEALAFHGPTKGIAVAGNVLVVRQADSSLVTLTGHAGSILGVAFSADGKFLLSGGSDGTVRLWDVQEGQEVQCFAGHADKVHAVAWSPDQRTAFSGGADGTIRRWPLP